MALLIAILMTVTLSAPFGEAEAHALGAPSARTFDISVEVEGEPAAVIARMTGLGGELDPVALVPRGGGVYGQVIQLTAWEDVEVTFEYIATDGETELSDASKLSELGVDPELLGQSAPESEPATTEDPGVDPRLVAGVAAALAAVVLLAFWASGGLALPEKVDDWTFSATVEGTDDEASSPDEEPVTTDESTT